MAHKPPLTPAKALAYANGEARRRWGNDARAWHPAGECRGGMGYCCVGVTGGFPDERRWTVYGLGSTWLEAFVDAHERGH